MNIVSWLDLERFLLLISVMAGVVGGASVAYKKPCLLISSLLVYESIALVMLIRSSQSVAFSLVEQCLAFAFAYVIATSLTNLGRAVKAAILASVFPVILVLIKPLRIYFFCDLVFLCEF